MDNRNAQVYMESRIKAPGARPGPGLRTASKRAGVEPIRSVVSQVVFPDAVRMSSRKQPLSAPGGPEKGPGHREASEEGPAEVRTQEQREKRSPRGPQEGPGEPQAGQDQATPGSELGMLPSGVPAAHAGMKQLGSGKETEDEQRGQQTPGTVEGEAPESCQVSGPGVSAYPRSPGSGGVRRGTASRALLPLGQLWTAAGRQAPQRGRRSTHPATRGSAGVRPREI
uniref:Uncharacterized protein n=1 Tax=Equus asinus asinus TaxID=83772 RepID=A0A8C4M9M9_EQUAS